MIGQKVTARGGHIFCCELWADLVVVRLGNVTCKSCGMELEIQD